MNFFKKIRTVLFRKKGVSKKGSCKDIKDKQIIKQVTVPRDSAERTESQDNKSQQTIIKVVITGSVGAGKTTAIHAISEKAPVTTETKPSDDVKDLKDSTTTTMDYGSYTHLGKKIHIYGTPGQQRFGFMSGVLTKGASGLVILIANNQDNPLEELEYYLQCNQAFLTKKPAIIGITHLDIKNKHDISIYTDYLEKQGIKWPVLSIDARKKTDVLGLIDQVIQAALKPKFR